MDFGISAMVGELDDAFGSKKQLSATNRKKANAPRPRTNALPDVEVAPSRGAVKNAASELADAGVGTGNVGRKSNTVLSKDKLKNAKKSSPSLSKNQQKMQSQTVKNYLPKSTEEKVTTKINNINLNTKNSNTYYKSNNITLLSGAEWYRYLEDTYGFDNVIWEAYSVQDIIEHPTSIRGYSVDELKEILGKEWIQGEYGKSGSGWKFTKKSTDNMIYYHNADGKHKGAYHGISTGKTGKMKFVDDNTYLPFTDDGATIFYKKDW